jgi:hypothetical protein
MATQVNRGYYTTQIFYTNTDTQSAIRAMITTFVVAHGWEAVSQSLATSDVYRSLDTGGTAGNAAHYSYVELDYSIASRVVQRQWRSWTGSAGALKAQNTFYVSLVTGQSGVCTESDSGQGFDISLGGSITLNISRGRFCTYGSIPGRSGDISSGCTLVIERTRVHNADLVGGSPACILVKTGTMFRSNAHLTTSRFRWSCPVGIADGSSGLTTQCGDQSGFSCLETGEFVYSDAYYNFDRTDTYQNSIQLAVINSPGLIEGSTRAGAIFPNISKVASIPYYVDFLGALQGACRQYGASFGSLIQTKADIYGIPSGASGADTIYETMPGGIALVQ